MHKEIPMMKGHNILNKADFKTLSNDGSLPSFPTQRCSLHKEEVVKLYCKDHDQVECASCIALTHRPESKLPTSKSKDQIHTPKVPVSKPESQTYSPKEGLYRVKQQREIDVKLQNDNNTCFIWGSCITEDDYLLLADSNNKRLKCMDMSTHKVKAYIDLPASPRAVCTISKTEAAVTLSNNTVQFVSLGDTMTVTRTLTMTHTCWCLAYSDGKLFISDNDKTVYMYNMTGQELKRITQDASGRDIFWQTQYIAVSASADRVFVVDGFKGVVVLDSQENYLSTFSDNNVSGYKGVCTDGRNVFVSGCSSGNIVQFGQDLRMLGEIAKVREPWSLCFDHQQKRLIATCFVNDKITVLELE